MENGTIGPQVKSIRDHRGIELAILISKPSFSPGVQFLTSNDLQQQVALMSREEGYRIPAHTHLPLSREVRGTQEVLIIRSGSMRVDIYDQERLLVQSETLSGGDVVILIAGGHGFTMLEDCEFIEVKQGPYVPGKDKEIFESGELA